MEHNNKIKRLCIYWVKNQCKYGEECRNAHGNSLRYSFDPFQFYPVKAALQELKDIEWVIEESNYERKPRCTIHYLKSNVEVPEKITKVVQSVTDKFRDDQCASITRYIKEIQEETQCREYGTNFISNPKKIRHPETKVNPIELKKSKDLKFWSVKKNPASITMLSNTELKPILQKKEININVATIAKSKYSKPVSAVGVTCGTKNFATKILEPEETAPDIVCSGSTLSQILNWLMLLHYNCERPLISFERMRKSIWAHCLYPDPNKVPTTQSDEGMNFATSVEEFFLGDVIPDEYVYGSCSMVFGKLKLLTYFEVDGFVDGQPLEIKSRKNVTSYLNRTSIESVSNSYIFTVKSHFRYLLYTGKELTKDGSKYSLTEGKISDKLSDEPKIDQSHYLKELHDILTRVQTILGNKDNHAVILKFRAQDSEIDFIEVQKNGGQIYYEAPKPSKSKAQAKKNFSENKKEKPSACNNRYAIFNNDSD